MEQEIREKKKKRNEHTIPVTQRGNGTEHRGIGKRKAVVRVKVGGRDIIRYKLGETSHKLNKTLARVGLMVCIKGIVCDHIDGSVKSESRNVFDRVVEISNQSKLRGNKREEETKKRPTSRGIEGERNRAKRE